VSGVVVIAGPTGVGKSETAVEVALRIDGEIVNYDSVQFYRGFDIGSAKADRALRDRVPHHLLDVAEADAPLDAAEFASRAQAVCDRLIGDGKVPILVGGTGFYLRALLGELPDLPGRDEELRDRIQAIRRHARGPLWLFRMLRRVDPVTVEKISSNDRHRVERALEVWLQAGRPISSWDRPATTAVRYDTRKFALVLDRATLVTRLDVRVTRMFDEGLIDEVRALLDRLPKTARALDTIGYREAVAYLDGRLTLDGARNEVARRTRAYAKRQMTWLRGEPDVEWIDASGGPEEAAARIERALRS
jgi:tRNA dimethylallyltransferase